MSYESALEELAQANISPDVVKTDNKNEDNDLELKLILTIEQVTNKKLSDEQRNILLTHDNMNVVACAGSGKTSTSVLLLAKRIITGEIADTNKLVCTTYSKGGALEMEERLHQILKMFNVDRPIKVVTLHAFFLSIIRTFGLNLEIVGSESERLGYIRGAAKDASFELRDDDLVNLSNLISYQVNNLLSDKKALDSQANTLENLTLDKYIIIRKGYATRKAKDGKIDFDDMQMYLYKWLVKDKDSTNEVERASATNVRNYCKAMWDYFFVDEAQDVSKIQFAIIKEMIANPLEKDKLDKGLVLVGDDDQCLPGNTLIYTQRGHVNIEDVTLNDKVLSAIGDGKLGYVNIDNIKKQASKNIIYKIKTKSGKEITCTWEHKMFVNRTFNNFYRPSVILFGGESHDSNGIKSSTFVIHNKDNNDYYMESFDLDALDIYNEHRHSIEQYRREYTPTETADILGNKRHIYNVVKACDLIVGDFVPTIVKADNIEESEIINDMVVSIEQEDTDIYVYDLSVPATRNFVANDVIVHNCIYKWRGADPSIILNICNMFNMSMKMLSTNYRCKENIVNFAAASVKNNTARYSKEIKAFNKGGTVKVAVSKKNDLNALSIIALNHIKRLINKGERVNDICVMSRNNFHLALLSNMLLSEGIYTTSTHDMKLTNSSMYKDIKYILQICDNCYDTNVTRNILWRLCKYMSVSNSSAIAQFQDSIGLNFIDTITYMLQYFDRQKNINLGRNIKVPIQAEAAMNLKWSRFNVETINSILAIYAIFKDTDNSIDKRVEQLMSMYLNCAGELLYKREDKSRSIKGLCNYIILMLRKRGYENTMEFLRMTEQIEYGTMETPGEKLTLTTIHSAKGKEWKNVIAFACDNVTMPSKENLTMMLRDGQTINDINEYINEERRLYYVETTRAKENLLIITYMQPSIFIMESLGAEIGNGQRSNYELISALSKDDYTRDKAFNDLFDTQVIEDKILNSDSEYYYEIEEKQNEK